MDSEAWRGAGHTEGVRRAWEEEEQAMKDDPSASSLNKGPSIVTASASCSVDMGSCSVARSRCFG